MYNQYEMQISQPAIMIRETRDSLMEVFNNHAAGSLAIGDQQFDDLVQKYLLTKTPNLTYEKIVKPIISRNLYESEARAAGSGEIFLRLLFEYFDHKNSKFSNVDWIKLNKNLNLYAKIKPRKSEIFNFIDQNCNASIASIVKEVILKSQKDDQIEVIRGFNLNTTITAMTGCNFDDIKIDPIYSNSKNWKRSKVKIILVDGVIEKSIHIEHILTLSNKDKAPYVIICREATDEVKNVCSNNFLRQTTDVVLCTAPYSEKTAHLFEDLRLITDADVICPEMGDIITASIYNKSKIINNIEISKSGFNIENGKAAELIDQRTRLLKNMNEINDENVSDLIRKRIKSLSSKRLVINVGNDVLMNNRNAIEQIDKILRELKDVFLTGLVEVKDHMPFTNQDKTFCSTNSIRVGTSTFSSFIKIFEESGLILMK